MSILRTVIAKLSHTDRPVFAIKKVPTKYTWLKEAVRIAKAIPAKFTEENIRTAKREVGRLYGILCSLERQLTPVRKGQYRMATDQMPARMYKMPLGTSYAIGMAGSPEDIAQAFNIFYNYGGVHSGADFHELGDKFAYFWTDEHSVLQALTVWQLNELREELPREQTKGLPGGLWEQAAKRAQAIYATFIPETFLKFEDQAEYAEEQKGRFKFHEQEEHETEMAPSKELTERSWPTEKLETETSKEFRNW